MNLRYIAALAAALLAAAPAAAQQTQTYVSDGGGYSLELPAGWRRLTPDELAAERRKRSGQATGSAFEAAFDPGDGSGPELVAVARMELGEEMTMEELEAEFTRAGAQADVQEGMNTTPAAQARARVNVPRWDEASRAAWMRVTFTSTGGSEDWMLAGFTLAPSRHELVVVMYFGTARTDEAAARTALEAAIRSLRPS